MAAANRPDSHQARDSVGTARRAPGRSSRRAGLWIAATVVVGAGVFVAGAVWRDSSIAPVPKAERPVKPEAAMGVVQLAPDGDVCRQVQIDYKTGRVVERSRIACKDAAVPADSKDAFKQRFSNGRLESIRDSFTSRQSGSARD
jgi:hypothetical protein